jgi:hypothetical protein
MGRQAIVGFGRLLAILPALGLAACAGSGGGPTIGQAGMACVADPGRDWVKEPPSAHAYASGVRLFAFKTKKKELSCDELAMGRKEADAAPGVLRSPGNGGLTPAQVSRGVMFAAEVSRELGNEMGRRCKKA